MKKIGFIDYAIDNFHANLYVPLFRKGRFKDVMDVVYAFEKKRISGIGIDQWCAKFNVQKLNSPEEVVDKSDYIVVLSPDNSEQHYELSEYALKSGKPTYVDKTFAPDADTARKMIDLAEKYNTPMFSTSALRYANELDDFVKKIKGDLPVTFVSTRGPDEWYRYAVHQVEMLVVLLGTGARRMMQVGKGNTVVMTIDYDDQRSAIVNVVKADLTIDGTAYSLGFNVNLTFGNGAYAFPINSAIFDNLLNEMAEFFHTGKTLVPHEEIMEVMKILDAGRKAIENPFQWIEIVRV